MVLAQAEEEMKISRIINVINKMGNSDDFASYFRRVQESSCAYGPTRDEARKDYEALMTSRMIR